MHFFQVIVKNVLRRKVRSLLTGLAVALAVAFATTMLGFASGLETSSNDVYQRHGVDLVVAAAGRAERMTSSLSEDLGNQIAKLPGVAAINPSLTDMVSMNEGSILGVTIHGWPTDSFMFDSLLILRGRKLNADDPYGVLLGKSLADAIGKKPGDTIEIEGAQFKVVGIYEGTNLLENATAIVPLPTLRTVMDRAGQVSDYQIKLTPEAAKQRDGVEAVKREVESLTDSTGQPWGVAAQSTEEFVTSSTEIRMAHGLAWFTTVVAILIGSVGMLNAMTMAVFERTQEIGILRAIGWRPSRVVRMILGESLLIGAVGAGAGLIAAVGLTHLLSALPAVQGLFRADVSPHVAGIGLLLALVVGLIGGAYPALRSSYLLPTEALRHE